MSRKRKKSQKQHKRKELSFHLPLLLIGVVFLVFGLFQLGLFPNGILVKSSALGPKPNIIVIMTDDQAPYSESKMPYLSSKPHGDWIDFTNSFVNNPLCCPSRATFFTGQYEHNHGVRSNDQGYNLADAESLAPWLSNAGYKTALVGKYLNGFPFVDHGQTETYIPPGWDEWRAFVGNTSYGVYDLNENGTIVNYLKGTNSYSTDIFTQKAVDFINTTNEPFFLYYAPHNPHAPFDPAKRHRGVHDTVPVVHNPNFNEADVSDKPSWVKQQPLYTPEQILQLERNERKSWDSMLSVDEAIEKFITALDQKGQLNNTIIIFTSDHGYAWGQHRWNKKQCEYEECIRTPFLMRVPGVGNRTESRLVQNIDLAPTLVDFAGSQIPSSVDGVSLLPIINGTVTEWRTNILIRGHVPGTAWWGVRTNDWKYIELEKTKEKELYDLVNDPYELENLAGNPSYASTQSNLVSQLTALRGLTPPTNSPTPGSTTPTATTTPVNQKPIVYFTSLQGDDTVSGTVVITAEATDDSGIKAVNLFIDGVKFANDETAPYSFTWDTTAYSNGSHTLYMNAVDNTKQNGRSESVTVSVSN